jgi:Gas vesicle synthesis protein GvpL/GvpF
VTETSTETGWYVYGVVESDAVSEEALAAGRLRLVRRGTLAAVVGPADLDEFGEPEVIVERLNDAAWLEQKARAHDAVLERIGRQATVIPLRFGAVYRRLDDVSELLDERGEELRQVLERVRGCVELGVKAWIDRPQLDLALARERPAAGESEGSGRAYLQRLQDERDVAARTTTLLRDAAMTAHERLLRAAVAGVANRPQPRELTGRTEQMLLNGAYLVRAGDESLQREVRLLADELAALGISFEVTGPWPPYNFVGSDEAEQ